VGIDAKFARYAAGLRCVRYIGADGISSACLYGDDVIALVVGYSGIAVIVR
jgi:hypothetical protein